MKQQKLKNLNEQDEKYNNTINKEYSKGGK